MTTVEWESVAGFCWLHLARILSIIPALYAQHFQVDKDIVKDMLQQKYKAYPSSMNWQNARTLVLKCHSQILRCENCLLQTV